MRTTPREARNFKNIKDAFHISEIQKAVLIGTLLGDAGLARRGKEYRLHIKHGLSQLFYVEYKYRLFADITSMPIRVFDQIVKERTYSFAEFVTLTHPEFSKMHSLFYPGNKKTITAQLCHAIQDPLSIAVWFMDDGTREYAGATFSTHCFARTEINKLQHVLQQRFNLPSISHRNKGKWVIYIKKQHLPILRNLISRYILPQFLYKLEPYSQNPKPVETTRQTPVISG